MRICLHLLHGDLFLCSAGDVSLLFSQRGSESKELKKPPEKKRQLEAILEETQTSNGTLEEEPSGYGFLVL